MACVFMDSFSHYSIGQVLRKWSTQGGTAATFDDTVQLHPGASQVIYFPSNATQQNLVRNITGITTVVVGFYVRFTAVATAAAFCELLESATVHVDLRLNTSGQLVVTRNGTALATSSNSFSANTWYHVEAKVTIGDAADSPSGRYQVRVNGSTTGWIADSGTGQDTRNAGTQTVNQVKIRSANGFGTYFSSFYILDTTGSVANDFVGPSRVAVLRPAGVGNYSQWTPNYAGNFVNVSEDLADDDLSFNQSSTANQIDTFPIVELPSGATVHALQYAITARQDAGAARTIAPLTRISTTDYAGTNYSTSASYGMDVEALTLSPATSAQWTVSEVNGAEFGYKLIS